MAMNQKEQEFKNNLVKKIDFYNIRDRETEKKLTVQDCLKYATNEFITVEYNDGSQELINVGIEKYLYKCSPYLFIDKNCYIDLPGKGRMPASNLYYYQKMVLKTYSAKTSKYVFVKSRQVGMSTLSSLIIYWKVLNFPNECVLIISKDKDSAVDVLKKVKNNLEELPSWLGIYTTKNNETNLVFNNKSIIRSYACSPTSGRGTSPTCVVLDECSFYRTANMAEGIVSSVVPSLSRTAGQMFVISTPNGSAEHSAGYWYYKQVQDLKNIGGVDYTSDGVVQSRLVDVSWWEIPDLEGLPPYKGFNKQVQDYINRDYFNNPEVKQEAENFFAPIAANPEENDWLKFQNKSSGPVKYKQEILKNFTITGDTVFTDEMIEDLQSRCYQPIDQGNLGNRYWRGLWYWQKPEDGHKYILGVDVSKGSGSDSSAIHVIDMETLEQCAEYVGQISTKEFSKLINDLGLYYNTAFLVVESNSIGEAVFMELYYNYNYPNMYKLKKINKLDKSQIFTGWMTTNTSRANITNKFIETICNNETRKNVMIHSNRLVDQMKTWVWSQANRPDHQSGKHDDLILSFCIAFYNIEKAAITSQNSIQSGSTIFVAPDGQEISVNSWTDKEEREEEFNKSMKEQEGWNGINDPLSTYRWLIG